MSGPASPFTVELIVEGYLNSVRIDSFLEKHLRNHTPYRIHRMIRAGLVRVNDETVALAQRVYRGNRVVVTVVEPPDKLLPPQPRRLDIVYEDPWLIAVNKPPGLVAHPCGDFQTGTLANAIQAHLDRQTALPGLLRPGIVHRLDRLTSGVVIVPKEHLSHRRLSIEFQKERVSKTYVALLDGLLPNDSGLIDYPIGRIPDGSSILATCRGDGVDPQPSKTRYEVLQRYRRHTLVRAKPATGRFHQIRVHFATLGYPVTADEFYEPFGTVRPPRPRDGSRAASTQPFDEESWHDEWGENDGPASGVDTFPDESNDASTPPDQADEDAPLMRRHALHAHRIEFTHPITQEWMEITAPLAADLRAAILRLAAEAGVPPATP